MRSSEESLRILEQALGIASSGVDEAEVSLGGGVVGLTRFADNVVHQSLSVDREVMAIRVITEGRVGRAETSDCTPQGIQAAARQARMLAELLPAHDGPISLPDAQQYETVDAYDPDTDRATPLDRMAIVGRAIVQAHRDQLRASGYVATCFGTVGADLMPGGAYAIANSKGVAGYFAPTRADMSVTMLDRREMSGWAQAESFALGAIDPDAITEIAAQKAEVPGIAEDISIGEHTVVLEPAAVASLLQFLARSCGAEAVASGRSFLSGRIGERIANATVSITDDFSHPLHRGCPFDAEGVARRPVSIIESGVAKGAVYSHASALREGVEATGHKVIDSIFGEHEAAQHIVMDGGTETLESLVGETESGVLVSRLWYTQLVDPRELVLTGVTRDGTFIIREGEVIAPARNMRFNVSLLDVLDAIDGIGPQTMAQGMVVPTVRTRGFRFTEPSH